MSCRKLPITWSFMDSNPKKCCLPLLNLIQCITYRKWYLQHVPKSILLKYLSASGNFTKASLLVFCWCVMHYHVLTSLLPHNFCSLKVQAQHSWFFFSRSHWAEVKALAMVVHLTRGLGSTYKLTSCWQDSFSCGCRTVAPICSSCQSVTTVSP